MPADPVLPSDIADDNEDADSCVCGLEHLDDEATSDEELPPTSGGIAQAEQQGPEDEDDVDGCELDFTAAEQTGDAELPAAAGGA